VHHHALGHLGGAGDLQLRRLLDLDQTHATQARDRESRVVAIVRHEDAGLLRGLDHERALGHAYRDAVDRQRDQFVGHGAGLR